MRLPLPKQRRTWVTQGIVVPMLAILLLISGLFPWSPLNCWHEEVDINSGRVRRTRYLLYCQISDRTEDTWLSRLRSQSNGTPDWHRVNTFSPGTGHSPHYLFHGAIHQIETLERADGMVPFDSHARLKVADTLLALWQAGGSRFDADEFVEKISQTAITLHDHRASVFTASDLPTHEVIRSGEGG